ncbi:MAG: hypothetical protein B6244_01700 [Candidatus Cloacimonetes bacterium 4572_55]|nr:MAG: hypothetical protein B6244_01700 [Candidatus Cloacimonetes bacterium 4572_55]
MQKRPFGLLFLGVILSLLLVPASSQAQCENGSSPWLDDFYNEDCVAAGQPDDNIIIDPSVPGLVILAPGQTGTLIDGVPSPPGRLFLDRVDWDESVNISIVDGNPVTNGDYVTLRNNGTYSEDFRHTTYRSPITTAEWDTVGKDSRGELRVREDDRWLLNNKNETGYRFNDIYWPNENIGWIVGNNGRVQKTEDMGENWIDVDPPIFSDKNLLSVFFLSVERGWITAEQGYAWQTTNGGSTWQQIVSPGFFNNSDLNDVCFFNTGEGWIAGEHGQIWHDPGSSSWQPQSVENVEGDLNHIFLYDDGATRSGYIVGDSNTFLRYNTVMGEWEGQEATGLPNPAQDLKSIFFVSPTTGWLVGNQGTVLRTRNNGNSWTDEHEPEGMQNLNVNDIFFVTTDIGWLVTDGGSIYKTENGTTIDGRVDWVFQDVEQPNNNYPYDLEAVFFINEGVGWIVGHRETRLLNPYYYVDEYFDGISVKVNVPDVRFNFPDFNPNLNVLSVSFTGYLDYSECGDGDCEDAIAYISVNSDEMNPIWREMDLTVDEVIDGITVVKGELDFSDATGNNLRWRMSLQTHNSNVTPYVDDIHLDYTTEYNTDEPGVFTSLCDYADETGYPDKNKSFTQLRWIQPYTSDVDEYITMEYSIDNSDEWYEAALDVGSPIPIDGGAYLRFTSTLDGVVGKCLRYRATIGSVGGGTPPQLLEVWVDYGYVPSGTLFSKQISKQSEQPWDSLTVTPGIIPSGTFLNIEIVNLQGVILDQINLISNVTEDFVIRNTYFDNEPALQLKANLASDSNRDYTPALDIWNLAWEGGTGPSDSSRIYFSTATGGLKVGPYVIGNENDRIYSTVFDPNANLSPNSNDVVTVVIYNDDITPSDYEGLTCYEFNLTTGAYSTNSDNFLCGPLPSLDVEDNPSVVPNDNELSARHLNVIRGEYGERSAFASMTEGGPAPSPVDDVFTNLIIAPNPHYGNDPDVIIRFDVNGDTFLSGEVHIYNIAGEWIQELQSEPTTRLADDGVTTIHSQIAIWNLTNHAGKGVMSGTYLIHVIGKDSRLGTKEQTEKLVVVWTDRPN